MKLSYKDLAEKYKDYKHEINNGIDINQVWSLKRICVSAQAPSEDVDKEIGILIFFRYGNRHGQNRMFPEGIVAN